MQRPPMDRRAATPGGRQHRPLGVLDLVTHTVPIAEAPGMYKTFQEKADGCIKVVIKP